MLPLGASRAVGGSFLGLTSNPTSFRILSSVIFGDSIGLWIGAATGYGTNPPNSAYAAIPRRVGRGTSSTSSLKIEEEMQTAITTLARSQVKQARTTITQDPESGYII